LQIFAAKSGFSKFSVVATSEDVEKQKAGIRYIHVQEHHFDSTVKRMTVIFRDLDQGTNIAFMKGAPERVLDACLYNSQGDILTEDAKNGVLKLMDRFAGEGLRVLALASKPLKEENMSRDCVENEMHLLGLVGIYDPPRLESLPSVQECQRAGIVVHMLTGDHIATATAIAKEVGIITPSTHSRTSVITAQDFDRMTDHEIDSLSSLPLVVARCSPATKVKMVKAIHRRSRLTAMTGDGVNDSPSLKAADVGIAMGLAGSDVARQAAEIVLADDNFATIVGAVEEGRRIFDNLVKFMLHLMSSNCAEVIVLVVGLAFMDNSRKPVYPLSPVQILWENLITSAFPAFAYFPSSERCG
jgi:potassium/sodium efflux P-type ATPase